MRVTRLIARVVLYPAHDLRLRWRVRKLFNLTHGYKGRNTIIRDNVRLDDATINIGTGRALSILELADLFSPKRVWLPPRQHDIPHQQADTTRMELLLGWRPRHDIRDYLARSLGERRSRQMAAASGLNGPPRRELNIEFTLTPQTLS